MGFSLKKLVQIVTAPVVVPVKAAIDIAQGKNLVDSAVKGATGYMAATNPLVQANVATDGNLAKVSGGIPVIGTLLETNMAAGANLAAYDGHKSDVIGYGVSTAALGGLVAGGVALAGSAGGASLLGGGGTEASGIIESFTGLPTEQLGGAALGLATGALGLGGSGGGGGSDASRMPASAATPVAASGITGTQVLIASGIALVLIGGVYLARRKGK